LRRCGYVDAIDIGTNKPLSRAVPPWRNPSRRTAP